MTFQEFEANVIKLSSLKPAWCVLDRDPPATEAEIAIAESSLSVALPSAYRDFVRVFGGGYFMLGNVFSVSEGSEWNIVKRNQEFPVRGFVSVSSNGTGDCYGFQVVDGACVDAVSFWDHEARDYMPATPYSDLLEFLTATAIVSR